MVNSFKKFMSEMTMSFGQAFYSMPDFSDAKHVGDIENNKILHKIFNDNELYGITVSDKPVCFIQTKNKNISGTNYTEIGNIFTEEQYRGQNLAKKLLFFLRNIEKKSFVFGDVQSKMGQDFVKSISKTRRFPMFWLNVETGWKKEYSHAEDHPGLEPYRSFSQPTKWVVIAEGYKGKDFMSRFIPESIEMGYNWWHRNIVWFE